MKKVTTINLNSNAYNIEEDGYALLSGYLDQARLRLSGNPDADEIIKDFEQAIAEKFDGYLHRTKTVITTEEIESIIASMGPVATDDAQEEQAETATARAPKRLYRIREGAWVVGVANGIAAYFDIDVVIVRILFVILGVITHGGAIFFYLIFVVFVPVARTNDEKAMARGEHFNAQEFFDRLRNKYGSYKNDAYWKTFAEKESTYWKNFYKQSRFANLRNSFLSFSRIGTGIIMVVLSIMLGILGVAWAIGIWTLIVGGPQLWSPVFAGTSAVLIGIFITALFYLIGWPLKRMLMKAKEHTWNMPHARRTHTTIAGGIVWGVMLGIAAAFIILTFREEFGKRMPYGYEYVHDGHVVCIGGNGYCEQ